MDEYSYETSHSYDTGINESIESQEPLDVAIEDIYLCIEDVQCNGEEFREILDDTFRFYMTIDRVYDLVGELYEYAFEKKRYDLIKIILEQQQTYNYDEETYTSLGRMFTYVLPTGFFESIETVIPLDYFEIVLGLFRNPNENQITRAIKNLRDLFPSEKLNAEDLRKFIARLDAVNDETERPNVALHDYLTDILQDVTDNPYAPVPDWVIGINTYKNFPEIADWIRNLYAASKLPSHEQLMNILPKPVYHQHHSKTAEDSAEFLNDIVFKMVDDVDADVETKFRIDTIKDMKRQTPTEREFGINWFLKNESEMLLMNDPEIQRVLGGSFPIRENINRDSNSMDPCSRYGGCRAMVCYENHNYDDDLDDIKIPNIVEQNRLSEVEWFVGYCANCYRRIRQKHHAIRTIPMRGGWYGCYCSFKCVKDDIPDEVGDEEREFRLHIIGIFEKIYNLFGVYDRSYP